MHKISKLKYFLPELSSDCLLISSLKFNLPSASDNSSFFAASFQSPLDPFELVKSDMLDFSRSIQSYLQSGDSPLDNITQYYFKHPGKHIRPTIALILAKALNAGAGPFDAAVIHRAQSVFAQVIEMIHCSSLIHDDVIDHGETRRGQEAIHKRVGNKAAVLGGDYLISTASLMCTELKDLRLIELISEIIENLSKGELIQADGQEEELDDMLAAYCHKTYFKTASLIAHGCKGVGMYGGNTEKCFQFGKHLGMAFQYVDDVLDFVGDKKTLGKPNLNDMKEGLATGPVLFACAHVPELLPAVRRKFKGEGDIEQGKAAAERFGIETTRKLALLHMEKAMKSVDFLPPDSFAYKALLSIASKVYSRVS
jgi:geranylgeranyl pyrophosphate synthase